MNEIKYSKCCGKFMIKDKKFVGSISSKSTKIVEYGSLKCSRCGKTNKLTKQ